MSKYKRPESTFTEIVGEEWRSVLYYEEVYEVSNLGRVRRIADMPRRSKPPRLLKQTDSSGYQMVTLITEGREKHVGVHILVAQAFIGQVSAEGMEVNHIDGLPSNNIPSNLEWTTRSGNIRHAFKTGLMHGLKGTENPRAKLSEADVLNIKAQKGCASHRKLAQQYGVSHTAIRYIQNGRNWPHIREFPESR